MRVNQMISRVVAAAAGAGLIAGLATTASAGIRRYPAGRGFLVPGPVPAPDHGGVDGAG